MKTLSGLIVLCCLLSFLVPNAYAEQGIQHNDSLISSIKLLSNPLEIGVIHQANSEETAQYQSDVSVATLIASIPTLILLVGCSYTLKLQLTGSIQSSDKSPLAWGVPSIVIGIAGVIWGGIWCIVNWLVALPLLLTSIATFSLGIAIVDNYVKLQQEDESVVSSSSSSNFSLTFRSLAFSF